LTVRFSSYNGGRLRDGCRLFSERMLDDDVTVGVTLTGALTPAGLGMSTLVPLIEAGFIDWIISTGANLYHDAHFGLGTGDAPGQSPRVRRRSSGKRKWSASTTSSSTIPCCWTPTRSSVSIIREDEFQRSMSTAEFHWLCGKYIAERQKALGQKGQSAAGDVLRVRRTRLHLVARATPASA
jgi:deoxyhypusine synthase